MKSGSGSRLFKRSSRNLGLNFITLYCLDTVFGALYSNKEWVLCVFMFKGHEVHVNTLYMFK